MAEPGIMGELGIIELTRAKRLFRSLGAFLGNSGWLGHFRKSNLQFQMRLRGIELPSCADEFSGGPRRNQSVIEPFNLL